MKEAVPVNFFDMMTYNCRILGSSWFTTADAQEMADMVENGSLDLSFLEHWTYTLSQVDEAIANTENCNGGFTNFVVIPQ